VISPKQAQSTEWRNVVYEIDDWLSTGGRSFCLNDGRASLVTRLVTAYTAAGWSVEVVKYDGGVRLVFSSGTE